ncbi:MAG: CHASE domain-containing protein, partial [Burkholderiaceae bacterium]
MRHLTRFLPVLLAVAVLLAGGLATYMAAKALDDGINAQARLQFNKELDSVKQALQAHLEQLVTLMQGARGTFASSSELNRDEFNMLVESLELRTRYTDVSALNYVVRVPAADVQSFVSEREEALPRYRFRYANEPASA